MGVLVFCFYLSIVFLLLWGALWIQMKIRTYLLQQEFKSIFESNAIQFPLIKISSSYGWPTFVITFRNPEDMHYAIANGMIGAFKSSLQKRYGDDFNFDLAVDIRAL